MSYINKSVTSYGTEADFIEAFISSLVASDSRIVREQTAQQVADMFASSANTPRVSVVISGIVTIAFERQGNLGSTASGYNMSYTFNSSPRVISSMTFTGSRIDPSAAAQRCFKYQIISNTKAIFIRFGNHNSPFPLTTDIKGLIYSDTTNQISFFMANTGQCYVGSGDIACTKAVRLPYIRSLDDITQTEVIKHIALVGSSDELIANPDGIWDASTNYTTNVPLQIGNEQCCFIDNNTVMKC